MDSDKPNLDGFKKLLQLKKGESRLLFVTPLCYLRVTVTCNTKFLHTPAAYGCVKSYSGIKTHPLGTVTGSRHQDCNCNYRHQNQIAIFLMHLRDTIIELQGKEFPHQPKWLSLINFIICCKTIPYHRRYQHHLLPEAALKRLQEA